MLASISKSIRSRVTSNGSSRRVRILAAGCLVLVSWYETPGLVALEAALSGTPLVLPRGGCAREYFGDHAQYVAPDDLRAIRLATLGALSRSRSPQLASLVREHYTWRTAARITREAYEQVV